MPKQERLEDLHLPQNANCLLSFSSADGGFSIWVKVRRLQHRWEAIYTESHAREYRAMYPKQRSVGQFALTFECNGWAQFETLMQFFRSYVRTIGEQFDNKPTARPTMQVSMAVRNFLRYGVPVSGMSLGDHVGSMVFMPTVVFEAAHDPQDPTILTAADASQVDNSPSQPDVKNFFYPFSASSYDTSLKPDTQYDFTPGDPLFGWVNDVRDRFSDSVESILDSLGRANG